MVDVRAPAAVDADQLDVRVIEAPAAPPSPRHLPARSAFGDRLTRIRPLIAQLLAWSRRCAAWSHTRRALQVGTGLMLVLGAGATAALIAVGVLGVGTHSPTWLSQQPPLPLDSSASDQSVNVPPEVFGGEQYGPVPAAPAAVDLTNTVAQLVLQPADLPAGFTQLPGSDTGADPSRNLLASYHGAYQRATPAEAGSDATIGVFSFAGIYKDDESALLQLGNLDPDGLAREAGQPNLAGRFASARTVGDGSMAVHLAGNVAGVQVGVFIVAFRRGAVEGIVGVAAPLGSESLDTALQLANAQEARIEAHVPASGG